MAVCTRTACPECGYENAGSDLTCSLCGHVLERAARTPTEPFREPLEHPSPLRSARPRDDAAADRRERLLYLGIGLIAAPVFSLTPLLRFMGWFLGGLVHEMGHAAAAWFTGSPAFPAIRLDGHAAAFCRPQITLVAFAVWAALAFAAWQMRGHRRTLVALGLVVLAYPALAFTSARDLLHLLGGHLGELTFSTVCFWRALTGGFTHSRAERALYAVVAWYLLLENLWLCGRLMFSPAGRAWYRGSGSFGLTNDYVRVANDLLGTSLETVAAGMFLVGLAVLPLSLLLARRKG